MTHRIPDHIALCAATDLPATSDGAPDWVHLIPTVQGEVQTYDGRGPYLMADIEAVIQASMANPRGMPIDENHATDVAAPVGLPSPARGWIVELQARADGLWGRVEWTADGAKLVSDKAYRGLSPVLAVSKADKKTVGAVLRASLVNKPNLRGLTALQQEANMDLLKKLAEMLGLPPEASEDEVLSAIKAMKDYQTVEAMNSALAEIGTAFGLEGTAAPGEIVTAAKGYSKDAFVALQSELATVTGQLTTLQQEGAKKAATTFIDTAIAEGRVGVKPLRTHYIERHMQDAASVEKEIAAMPKIGGGPVITTTAPVEGETITELNAEQASVAEQLGIPPKDFIAQLNAELKKEKN